MRLRILLLLLFLFVGMSPGWAQSPNTTSHPSKPSGTKPRSDVSDGQPSDSSTPETDAPISYEPSMAEERFDEAVASAAGRRFTSLLDNRDRVHFSLQLSQSGLLLATLATPETWTAKRTEDALTAVTPLIGNAGTSPPTAIRNGSLVDRVLIVPRNLTSSPNQRPTSRSLVWRHEITLNWPAILAVLKRAGAEKVELRIRPNSAATLTASECGLNWTRIELAGRSSLVAVVTTTDAVSPMRLTYGFGDGEAHRAQLVLTVLFLVPTLLVLAARTRALSSAGDHGAYQSYRMIVQWTRIGTLVASSYGLSHYGVMNLLTPTLVGTSRGFRAFALLGLILGPTLFVSVVSALLSFAVEQRFRGLEGSRRAYYSRSFLYIALAGLPIILPIVGMVIAPDFTRNLLFGSDHRGGLLGGSIIPIIVFSVVIGFAARVASVQRMRPETVMHGELVEHIQALCRQANVTVSRVMLAHTERERVANAMVTSGGVVMLTDYLIRRFTRDEVDGVVAHELAHLRLNHLTKRRRVQILGFAVWGALIMAVRPLVETSTWNTLVFWTFWIVPAMATHYVSRRHEFEADAEAVVLTNNPQAYLRMLKKLAGLNAQPIRPGRVIEATATHPGIARRIAAIASRYQVAPDQVQALMAEADAAMQTPLPASPTAAVDQSAPPLMLGNFDLPLPAAPAAGYALPTRDAEQYNTPDRIFTSQVRGKQVWWQLLALFTPLGLIMWTTLSLIHRVSPDGTGWAAGAVCISGIGLTIVTGWLLLPCIGFVAMLVWKKRLVDRVRARYGLVPDRAIYVGMSPSGELQSYGGETSWDIGLLTLDTDALRYRGDACAFVLRPDQIAETEIRTHRYGAQPGTFARLFVTWRETPEAAPDTFNLELRDAHGFGELHRLTHDLQTQIETWRQTASSAVPFADTHFDMAAHGSDAKTLGLPPRSGSVLGAPVSNLAPESRAGYMPQAAAFVAALGLFALALAVAAQVLGRDAVSSDWVRWGGIVAVLWLYNQLLPRFRGWLSRSAPPTSKRTA